MRVALECWIFAEVRDLGAAMGILDGVGHPLRALLVDPIYVDRSDSRIVAMPPSIHRYFLSLNFAMRRPNGPIRIISMRSLPTRLTCADSAARATCR